VIEVCELSKSFGPVRALHQVTFNAEEGQVLGFLGPNGAGKSTTMRIITGFLPGDHGSVRVAGHDVARNSLAVRQLVGYLPEGVPIYPEMRVGEYLKFRARLKGVPRRERRAAVGKALESTDVADVRRRVIGTLSRGYRQRVGLADALLAEPRVLILDEPTIGLDPEQVRQFRQLLREVGRHRTVVLSTHILSEVEVSCSHVVVIHRGRIVARDTAANLRRKYGTVERTTAEVAGPIEEIRQRLERLPQVLTVHAVPLVPGSSPDPSSGNLSHESAAPEAATGPRFGYSRFIVESALGSDLREDVFKTVQQNGWLLRELRRQSVSLEDAFVEIVGVPMG